MDDNIKKLIRFLKQKRIFNKYVEEVKKAGIPTIDSTLVFCDTGPQDLLLYSFFWDKSADGEKYWAEIDNEWNEYLKKN